MYEVSIYTDITVRAPEGPRDHFVIACGVTQAPSQLTAWNCIIASGAACFAVLSLSHRLETTLWLLAYLNDLREDALASA